MISLSTDAGQRSNKFSKFENHGEKNEKKSYSDNFFTQMIRPIKGEYVKRKNSLGVSCTLIGEEGCKR